MDKYPIYSGEVAGWPYRVSVEALRSWIEGVWIEAVLELEPTNQHDPCAVMVRVNGVHVGYVPRTMSRVVCGLLNTEHKVTASVTRYGGFESKLLMGLELVVHNVKGENNATQG